MGCDCEECCRSCCYSTPFITLTVSSFLILSLVGFFLSGVYGSARMNDMPEISNGTVVVAPVITGMFVLTLIPLILITIMAYCTTGYIRDMMFHPAVKTCIGSTLCNGILLVILMTFLLLWIGMVIGLSGIMVYGVQMEFVCEKRDMEMEAFGLTSSNFTCLPFIDSDFTYSPICEDATVNRLCSSAEVRRSFYAALFFAVLVTMGIVVLGLVQVANYVSGRDHIDYRESTRNEYDMKRIR